MFQYMYAGGAKASPVFDADDLLIVSLTPFLQQINECIEPHCHYAQQNNTHKQPIHFKELRGDLDILNIVEADETYMKI